MSLADRVARWPHTWFREGFERGLEQGVELGIQSIAEGRQRDAITETAMRCETGEDLLREATRGGADQSQPVGDAPRLFPGSGRNVQYEDPPPDLTFEEICKMLVEELERQQDQWTRQGFDQGLERGTKLGKQAIERSIEQGRRELLLRQAEVLFGTDTAARLFLSLLRKNSPQRLDAIAEAVVRCATGEELLREVALVGPATDPNP